MNFRASLACIICAFAVGCATELPPAPRGKATETKGLALAPFAIKEECLHLKPGDRLDYRFASDQPVQFNVHYHDGKLILTPLSRNDASGDVGIYDPQSGRFTDVVL